VLIGYDEDPDSHLVGYEIQIVDPRSGRVLRRLRSVGQLVTATAEHLVAYHDPGPRRCPGRGSGEPRLHRDQPNQLWVADFTHVATWAGTVYVAFCIDVFSRVIVGWKAAISMRTQLVLDTIDMARWVRGRTGVNDLTGLVHHSDAGSQYTSIAFTDRLRDYGIDASIGSVGDAYDNALAESTIGLYKTELIKRLGPWRGLDHLEIATLEYIDWFNNRRLHGELNDIPRPSMNRPIAVSTGPPRPDTQQTESPSNSERFSRGAVGGSHFRGALSIWQMESRQLASSQVRGHPHITRTARTPIWSVDSGSVSGFGQ
jgi:transposase InsO family protein